MNKLNFEEIYNNYKLSNDTIKIIDGITYFKIIDRNKVSGFNIIALPNEKFTEPITKVHDNKGNVIEIGKPITYSFRDNIPDWYMETVHVLVNNISIDEIGEYVTPIKD